MSLIPVFELGFWNAWIFIGLFVFIDYGLGIYYSVPGRPPFKEREKKVMIILSMTFLISLIYSVFLPLKLGSFWFYTGFFVYLFGMIFLIMALYNFGTTSVNQLVTGGVYYVSRNPMWFGCFVIFVGTGLACASLIFLILAVVIISMERMLITAEERWCLETFGESYRQYMNKTPRWIGIPKK